MGSSSIHPASPHVYPTQSQILLDSVRMVEGAQIVVHKNKWRYSEITGHVGPQLLTKDKEPRGNTDTPALNNGGAGRNNGGR